MLAVLLKNEHLKSFLNKSGIHGLRLLLHYTPFKYARLIWLIFIFAVVIWTHFIIISLTLEYIRQPTEVHMSTARVHVSNTPFPGVAVCSANKFNRTKLLKFAKKVFEKQQIYKPHYVAQTTREMAQHLFYFKRFFIFPYDNESLNLTVISRLDEIFTFMFNTTNYPIRDYLKKLAPDCKSLIIRGTIYGAKIDTTEYFYKRMTSSSVCCMFNYNRKSYSIDSEQRYAADRFTNKAENIKFESNSILNSIQFVLRSESKDFSSTEFQNAAFQLYIFPRDDYATIQSNRIGEILVDHNTIVEVPIEPEFFGSTQQVRQFAPHVRNCYFADEGQKLLNQSFYSMDECLLLCRMESMIRHCGCVTPPMAGTNRNFTYCNFSNLSCLMKWKSIWYGWDLFAYVHANGEDKQDDFTSGHRCPKCLPRCNGVDFSLEVNEILMHSNNGEPFRHGILKGLNNSKPLSIVKLYFKQRYVSFTEMDIVGDWVVLLNRFGGIMSLMYGFSIMSYIEILYFATGKFFVFYVENWKLTLERKLFILMSVPEKDAKVSESLDFNLYWRELKPQLPLNKKMFERNAIKYWQPQKFESLYSRVIKSGAWRNHVPGGGSGEFINYRRSRKYQT